MCVVSQEEAGPPARRSTIAALQTYFPTPDEEWQLLPQKEVAATAAAASILATRTFANLPIELGQAILKHDDDAALLVCKWT